MSSLILISGEEDFLSETEARREALSSLASETFEYNIPDDLESYIHDSQTQFMSGKSRVFILWGVKDIPVLPGSELDTIICVAPPGKRILQDKRAKRSFVFPKLKSFQDNNDVVKWIIREGDFFNINLNRIAGALFVNSGTCLRKLHREIEKIAASVPPGTIVSPDEARSLIVFSTEVTPRDIIDAICDGHTHKAIAYLDKLQERADETGWIIAYMQRHVVQQLKLRESFELNLTGDVAKSIGVHPFILKKLLLTRLDLWTTKFLMTSLGTLCDLDIAHKRGDGSARFGLESEIIRMSEEVNNVK
jgi:hypothetical protein